MEKNNTDKLSRYLKGKTLEELANLRGLAGAICRDYDAVLTNYATINDDKAFKNMPREIEEQHKRRNKMHGLLMTINRIIEEKLFALYE